MNFEIYDCEDPTALDCNLGDKFELWFDDWDEAGIRRCWLAWVGNEIVGFLTRDGDFNCVAIEVLPQYRKQGIGKALCDKSNTWTPRHNENPDFWAAMQKAWETEAE